MKKTRGIRIFERLSEKGAQPSRDFKKGRSEELIKQRNELLLHRYYYYAKIIKVMQYDAVLQCLVTEFSLSPTTIHGIINKDLQELMTITAANPSIKSLAEKYPHMVWNAQVAIKKRA